jgi:hypothetical protein
MSRAFAFSLELHSGATYRDLHGGEPLPRYPPGCVRAQRNWGDHPVLGVHEENHLIAVPLQLPRGETSAITCSGDGLQFTDT